MASFSDNPAQFNIELLDEFYQALKDIAASGGVKSIKKGDFSASYRSPNEINNAIKDLKNTIYFQENGCRRKCL